MAKHIKKYTGRIRFWAGLLLAQFLLFFILSKTPEAIRFFEAFFERQKNAHMQLFAGFPFSVGDVLYILLILLIIIIIINIFKQGKRRKSFRLLLILLNVSYFIYQFFWGMLYFQPAIIEKLPGQEPTAAKAKELALQILERCKKTRNEVQEDRNGVFKLENSGLLKQEIIIQQNDIPAEINLKKPSGIISVKPSLFSSVMSFTGIAGYYNPFTAEAQYNALLPSSQIPATIAHETAHQLGFAREQEASFIGYLIGRDAENAELRYSTEFFALKSLLRSVYEEDSVFVEQTIASFSDGMQRDLDYERRFSEEHDSVLDVVFGFTNDLFLKSNQQEGSITYSYFVDLLIRYENGIKKNRVSQRDSKNTNDEKKYSLTQRRAPQ